MLYKRRSHFRTPPGVVEHAAARLGVGQTFFAKFFSKFGGNKRRKSHESCGL